MHPLLILLVIALGFWSVTTTFVAIYSILTKKFNGSKVTWILIVMIAIIGPFLWYYRGRKLLIKS